MTDAELATNLHLSPAEAAIVILKLTPQRRALFDCMKQIKVEVDRRVHCGPVARAQILSS